MDQMVRELLSASGGTFRNPATNFYQVETDTLKTAENVAQVFMGIRVQCAQCHNHPFDRWTMDDYYSFASFFAQIGRKQGEDYREIDRLQPRRRGRSTTRWAAGPWSPSSSAGRSRTWPERTAARCWPSGSPSPENPFFATSVANRVWAHFFGIGIVEPVDDVRVSNPASNPELLQALGGQIDRRTTTTSSSWSATSATRRPTSDPRQRNPTQRARRAQLRPRPDPPHRRPRCSWTASAR